MPQALPAVQKASEILSKPQTLDSLIQVALANNPATRASWSRAEAAQSAVGEARAPYFPKLTAKVVGGSDQWYTPAAVGPDNYRREQITPSLAIEYLLLDFGRRGADVQRTMALMTSAGFVYQRSLQQVVFAVQEAYFAHEAALWRRKAAGAASALAKVADATIEAEYKAGLQAEPEKLASRKRVLEAEYALEEAESAVRITRGNLCVATGLPANSRLEIKVDERPPSTGKLREEVDKWVDDALAARPDLAARASELRAAEASTRRARADFYPEVRLEAGYTYSAFGYDAQAGRVKGNYSEDRNGYGAFVVASWDLFDGFERSSRVEKRREEEKAIREDLEQARLEVTRDVWTSYNLSRAAARRVEYAESFVLSARESRDAIKAASQAGLSDAVELSRVENLLADAEFELAESVARYSTSLAALALAVGTVAPQVPPAKPSRE